MYPCTHLRQGVGVVEELPRIGSALPVELYDLPPGRVAMMKLPSPGEWVTLRNIGSVVVHGQLQACRYLAACISHCTT